MFSGIVEAVGKVVALEKEKSNLRISVSCPFVPELKIDQSISHNGVCLTVIDVQKQFYTVTAIQETLRKSNLDLLKESDLINLERGMKLGDRMDGHMVQGHVDTTAVCKSVKEERGSRLMLFEFDTKKFPDGEYLVVDKGSVCIDGVSLTVVNCSKNVFSVAVIPHTLQHTNFSRIRKGSMVNIEVDILGKYILKTLR